MNEEQKHSDQQLGEVLPYEHYIQRELQIAFDQVAHGEVSDLDMKELLVEAHRRHATRQQQDNA